MEIIRDGMALFLIEPYSVLIYEFSAAIDVIIFFLNEYTLPENFFLCQNTA